jgi:uncharacterized protein
MQPSIFNLRVPLPERNEVFLMNTLTDAQLVVSTDVADLLERCGSSTSQLGGFTAEEWDAVKVLTENGFLVASRESDHQSLDRYFEMVRSDRSELNVTVLTTLQCNFACDYCYQGDHGDYNKFAEKMSMETAARVAGWIDREMDRVGPERVVLTFFGGEPLLNLPVLYDLSERVHRSAERRGIPLRISIITNGLLLTEDIVDRLQPLGLQSVKITLDGDRDAHDRMRPLRGGQGTFDRIIENIRRVAPRVRINIGGNFDETSMDSFPALLDFLSEQEFADRLMRVNFKPVVRDDNAPSPAAALKATGLIPLTPVGSDGEAASSLKGTCMTSVGKGGGSGCDSCNLLDDRMEFLREETKRHGFATSDGVHVGPCHVHYGNAKTIGPDGSLYACPGFTGEQAMSVGHIDGRTDPVRESVRERFLRLSPWKECGECAFIPVCAGGCVTASHIQLGDMNAPTCHKRTYETALISLAHDVASAADAAAAA